MRFGVMVVLAAQIPHFMMFWFGLVVLMCYYSPSLFGAMQHAHTHMHAHPRTTPSRCQSWPPTVGLHSVAFSLCNPTPTHHPASKCQHRRGSSHSIRIVLAGHVCWSIPACSRLFRLSSSLAVECICSTCMHVPAALLYCNYMCVFIIRFSLPLRVQPKHANEFSQPLLTVGAWSSWSCLLFFGI